jgi:hypothetical protein
MWAKEMTMSFPIGLTNSKERNSRKNLEKPRKRSIFVNFFRKNRYARHIKIKETKKKIAKNKCEIMNLIFI